MPPNRARHPCFNDASRHTFARIHLPVAPRCNVQCNYCRHGQDCLNESRPGVTSAVLSPGQALHYLQQMVDRDPRIAVVGIAGPGDPFANAEATLETLRLVRAQYPEMLLCVATNGMNVGPYVEALAELKVSHVTLTVNAVDPAIGQKIYAWVRDGVRVYRWRTAAEVLLERQQAAVAALKAQGITVKVNTIIIPGVNDGHVPAVAQRMAELGADIFNCVALYAVPGTPFGELPPLPADRMESLRHAAGQFLPLMTHCSRCRADAAGLLGEPSGPESLVLLADAARLPIDPRQARPYVAAATHEGVLVNQHLGEAAHLAIYDRREDGFRQIATRPTPPAGGGPQRWEALADTLDDCRALLVASAGQAPSAVLAARGLRVVMMEGLIEEGLRAVYGGAEVRAPLRAEHRCGAGCAGNGQGCS